MDQRIFGSEEKIGDPSLIFARITISGQRAEFNINCRVDPKS